MEQVKKILDDLTFRALRTGKPCFSEFLSLEAVREAGFREDTKLRAGAYRLLGGHENPERVIFAALPFADFPLREEDVLGALKILPNDGGNYGHRDYLGSVLAVGIKRESVGDILIGEGCAWLIAAPGVLRIVKDNLASVSRTGAKCLPVPIGELPAIEKTPERLTLSVSALRLDCVLSAVFALSRNGAKLACERGLCSVNRLEAKPEKLLKAGDLVVLKGHGRFRIEGEAGLSKKGKIRLLVTKEGR